jgi:competence protein ComEA
MNYKNLSRAILVALTFFTFTISSTQVLAAKQEKASQVSANRISLNSANATILSEALSGVGLKKAQAIVAYREANGKFKRVEDLILVKGIGESILEKNKAKLTL